MFVDNEKWNFCCERGSLVELSGMDTCEEKADSVMLWGACKNAFVDCCIAKSRSCIFAVALRNKSNILMVIHLSVFKFYGALSTFIIEIKKAAESLNHKHFPVASHNSKYILHPFI